MFQTNNLRQFIILLYKGLLLRKRHYIVTFFEIIIPVLITVLPAIIMAAMALPKIEYDESDTSAKPRIEVSNATFFQPVDPFSSKTSLKYPLYFVHCPTNEATDEMMQKAGDMFKKKLNYQGDIKFTKERSEEDLESYALFKQKEGHEFFIMIGVVFENFDKKAGKFPDHLDYKIRLGSSDSPINFGTNLKYRVNGPQMNNVYKDTLFMAWQAAVEQSFVQIKMKGNNKEKEFQVIMQRFPYPEHKQSGSTFSVVNITPWFFGFGYLAFMCNLVRRIIEEKSNGSKELLKMMGMTDGVYWLSTFMNYFLFAALMMLITTIIYKVPLMNGHVFMKHIDFMALYCMLLLFSACLILFCMAFSIFFNKGWVHLFPFPLVAERVVVRGFESCHAGDGKEVVVIRELLDRVGKTLPQLQVSGKATPFSCG